MDGVVGLAAALSALGFQPSRCDAKVQALIEPWFEPTGSGDVRPVPLQRADYFRRSNNMAGVVGFEPTNAEIKTQCLAAWRHPSKSLHRGQRFVQWRKINTLRNKARC